MQAEQGSSSINALLEQFKESKLGEIKAEKVSSKATLTSRLNIEQTASLKRLKMYLIFASIGIFLFLIGYAFLAAYTEYKDIVKLVNTYGPQVGMTLSGFKVALCLRYPPLTSWFFSGNTALPEAIYVSYRTALFNGPFVQNLPSSLGDLWSLATIGSNCQNNSGTNQYPSTSANTSAAFLICCTDWASHITECETACNSNNSTNSTTSALNGISTGFSVSMATAGLFPPFGFIGGFIAGFCGGFFTSQYPPGASGLNECIS